MTPIIIMSLFSLRMCLVRKASLHSCIECGCLSVNLVVECRMLLLPSRFSLCHTCTVCRVPHHTGSGDVRATQQCCTHCNDIPDIDTRSLPHRGNEQDCDRIQQLNSTFGFSMKRGLRISVRKIDNIKNKKSFSPEFKLMLN